MKKIITIILAISFGISTYAQINDSISKKLTKDLEQVYSRGHINGFSVAIVNQDGTLSMYTLRVKDLLVSRRTIEDNLFAINAGKTTHNGIELDFNFDIIKRRAARLKFFFNTSIFDHKFDNFIDLDDDFSGNNLTGAPSEVINLGLDFTKEKGIYGNINFQTVGKIPANDANTVFSNSYELIHGKIGYRNTIDKHLFYDISIGVNNILDTKYASQLQINARGFGGNAPRYFYSGLPFNMYGGINIKYRLQTIFLCIFLM